MSFKDQLNKIKDNWFIAVLLLLLVFVFLGTGTINSFGSKATQKAYSSADYAYSGGVNSESIAGYNSYAKSGIVQPTSGSSFAPEVTDRKIVKTTSLSSEIERGTFQSAEQRLENIVSSTDSYLLYKNSNQRGMEPKEYYVGSYTIKVETEKYNSVIGQLKEIGKVTSFSESSTDITGSYTNANIELAAERERLKRYNDLYADSTIKLEDKINLIDRIYNQERTVQYWENSINNMDERVEYSTIQVTLSEKSPEYANVALVKISTLLRNFVNSFNGLLKFVFVIAPWAVSLGIILLIARSFRRKSQA